MLIVANWKANVDSVAKAKRLVATGKRLSAGKHEIVLAPSAPHLGFFAIGSRGKLAFAAQDISATLGGAETGEITAATVAGTGAKYVIVGHSERRALGDTDEIVLTKVRHGLAQGLIPIVCVGEHERDAEAHYLSFLRGQVAGVYAALSPKERMQIVLAYEPVWAIGKHASEGIHGTELNEMVLYLRKVLAEYLPGKAAANVRILYGGAVEPANIRTLAGASGIDGFLVGHISTDPASFTALVKAAS